MAGLTAGLGVFGYGEALAQTTTLEPIPLEGEETPPAAQPQDDDTAAGEGTGGAVAVEIGAGDAAAANTLNASTGTGRLSGDVQGTPQIINVIPQKLIQEQGITTLEQALTNVPGVTVRIGEGRGGLNGDQFQIRGLEAKGDIYVDGLRDFGVYVRDSFAYEGVQVFKGPSSETFGVGTTGGAINAELKKAHLGDKYRFEAAFSSDPLLRGGFDINKQINDTSALRVIGMGTDQEIADRDHVFNDRYGALVDFGTGLGTDTTWHLSYFHQHYDRMPDYGVPIITPLEGDAAAFGELGRPAPEFGLDRSNFYGKDTDKDVGNVHTLTSRFETQVNEWLTINNDTRLAYYDRDFATTVPSCSNDNEGDYATSCTGEFFAGGNPSVGFGGGNPGYYQESWGFQNILSAKADFYTGPLRHEAIVGLDYLYQDDDRIRNSVFPNNDAKLGSGQPILDPIFDSDGSYYIGRNPNDLKQSTSSNVALFASDRIWFTPEISVLAGLRWDYFDVSYDTYDGTDWTHLDQQSDFVAPKASLIWEPTPNQTYYLSWATSANINGQFPTNANATLDADELEPEENESWEIGGKWSVLDGRLGLSAAAFQIDRDNARYTDELGETVITGEEQRVRGFELGVSGMITPAWYFSAAYAYLDTEVRSDDGDSNAPNVGNEIANAPQNAFSLWTTYNMSTHFQQLPGTWLVGGGITYRDKVYTSSANTSIVPETFSLDLMTSYSWDKYRIAFNAYNVTDELNYSGVWGNRAIPASGRTFTLTLGAEF